MSRVELPETLLSHDISSRDWEVFDPMTSKLPGRGDRYFKGEEYQEYVDSLEWLAGPVVKRPADIREGGIQIGNYRFAHTELPLYTMQCPHMFAPLRRARAGLSIGPSTCDWYDNSPKAYFDTVVRIPVLCTALQTWMSITPMEMFTQRPGLRYAHGKVLIGGLGLGWFTHYVCLRKQAKEVVVVEKDRDLIEHFGQKLKAMHPKLSIEQGDAYDFLEENSCLFDSYLFDIWAGLGESEYDRRWTYFLENLEEGKRWWGWGTPRSILL